MGKAHQPRYLYKLSQVLELPVEWVLFGEVEDKSSKISSSNMFQEKSIEVLENFYAMPKKDQELLFELMKSRKK